MTSLFLLALFEEEKEDERFFLSFKMSAMLGLFFFILPLSEVLLEKESEPSIPLTVQPYLEPAALDLPLAALSKNLDFLAT